MILFPRQQEAQQGASLLISLSEALRVFPPGAGCPRMSSMLRLRVRPPGRSGGQTAPKQREEKRLVGTLLICYDSLNECSRLREAGRSVHRAQKGRRSISWSQSVIYNGRCTNSLFVASKRKACHPPIARLGTHWVCLALAMSTTI